MDLTLLISAFLRKVLRIKCSKGVGAESFDFLSHDLDNWAKSFETEDT
jgi:hypothetical protein